MSIATAIVAKQQQIADAYTAVSDKGGTLPDTQNLTNLATAILSIPSGGSGGKYQLLQRISDDNDNEIGTVSGFFTDTDGIEYAVVCLDAKDRLAASQYCSDTSIAIPDLPLLINQRYSWWYHSLDTAASNCNKILAFCELDGHTSTAASHCRTKSYTVDGTTYYGQLPNEKELFDIVDNMIAINDKDPTASSYTSVNFDSARNMWSSSQYSSSSAWFADASGHMSNFSKSYNSIAAPVLEIPLNRTFNKKLYLEELLDYEWDWEREIVTTNIEGYTVSITIPWEEQQEEPPTSPQIFSVLKDGVEVGDGKLYYDYNGSIGECYIVATSDSSGKNISGLDFEFSVEEDQETFICHLVIDRQHHEGNIRLFVNATDSGGGN